MAVGTTAAIIGAAVIGAGSAAYQAEEQRRTARDAQRRVDAENQRQQAEAARISRDTRPEGETVGQAVKLGVMDEDTMGVSDFLISKPTGQSPSGLNTGDQKSGLGFVL